MAESTDQEQLRLLSIFHYILAGIMALMACLPLIHVTVGIAMLAAPNSFGPDPSQQPPAFIGWFFIVVGGAFILFGQAFAFCLFLTGRYLGRRTRYQFCFVMACVECIFMPFGTVLGVLSIIALSRDSMKQLFQQTASPLPLA